MLRTAHCALATRRALAIALSTWREVSATAFLMHAGACGTSRGYRASRLVHAARAASRMRRIRVTAGLVSAGSRCPAPGSPCGYPCSLRDYRQWALIRGRNRVLVRPEAVSGRAARPET